MKQITITNINKKDGVITCDPCTLKDRAICYIPPVFFKGTKEVKAQGVACVYLNGTFKPYNRYSLEQDFVCNYLNLTIVG